MNLFKALNTAISASVKGVVREATTTPYRKFYNERISLRRPYFMNHRGEPFDGVGSRQVGCYVQSMAAKGKLADVDVDLLTKWLSIHGKSATTRANAHARVLTQYRRSQRWAAMRGIPQRR